MGIAKYYEDNMEIIDERMRDSSFYYHANTSINHYPHYPSKKSFEFKDTIEKQTSGYIMRNYEHNGIEIYFQTQPCYSVLRRLRQNSWSWHHQKRCWFKKYSANA